MNTADSQNAFHPYKIIQQGRTSLQLQPGTGTKAVTIIFWVIPFIMIVIGFVMFLTQKEVFYLFIFGGIALFEALIFSFIKIPAAVAMDSMGFTLETVSMKGKKVNYYLWSDVDFIRHRMVAAKNSATLNYTAVLHTGKKVNFLNFNNYHAKKQSIPEINAVLHDISKKEVREK